MSNFKDWSALRELSSEFLENIKNVYIFSKDTIFIVTKNDDVYSFGLNHNGCVGLGHCKQVPEPVIIKELCGKRVTKFAYSNKSCNALALTKSGVYSWGRNYCGQLGNNCLDDCYTPKQMLLGSLIDICCSNEGFCLALSATGIVYSWGQNKWGYLGISDLLSPTFRSTYPRKINALKDIKVVAIDCGTFHALALTDDGVVYGWGDNSYGQLGCGNSPQLCGSIITNYSHTPIKLSIADNISISKIRCGHSHSLILSTDGDVYAFGSNNCGQIGDASTKKKLTVPIKVELADKCAEIAAFGNSDISIAKLNDGYCCVWGACDGKSYSLPKKTFYERINEIVIHFCITKYSYDRIGNSTNNSIIRDRFSNSFNNPMYCDIAFKIDDKLIYAQKQYLISVCNHFEKLLTEDKNWSENLSKEIPIIQYSYSVYYSFLKYLYTGLVDISIDNAFELFDLANSYLEDELKQKSAQILIEEINIENVCEFYLRSKKNDLTELKESCVSFAVKNVGLVKQTDGYKQINDSEFLKQFI